MSLYSGSNDPLSYGSASRAIQWTEVVSNPSAPNGASQIQMRWKSSDSRLFVPSASYVVLKLSLGANQTASPLEGQVNSFPAHRLFQRMQYSIDSMRVESNDDCSSIASCYSDLNLSFAGSKTHNAAMNKQGVLEAVNSNEITLIFQPHLSVFTINYGIPGGEHSLTLFPKAATGGADFMNSIYNSFAAATAATTIGVIDGEVGLPNTTITGVDPGITAATGCTISSCSLMAAFASPQAPSPLQGIRTHLLSVYNVQTHEPSAASVSTTFTIPASTYAVTLLCVTKATLAAEMTGAVSCATSGLMNYSLRYGSNIYPFSPYSDLRTTDALRAYVDTVASRNMLEEGDEFTRSYDSWKLSPVFQHRIFVSAGDSPTQLHLRASFATAGLAQATRMILVMHSHEQLSLEYANQELQAVDITPIV